MGGVAWAPPAAAAPSAVVDTVIASDADERRAVLLAVLQMHQHRVLAQASTPEALGQVSAGTDPSGAIQVLLVDVDPLTMEWTEAARNFLGRRSGVRAILITPSRSAQTTRIAEAAGILQILRRPFSIPQLLEAMAQASAREPSGSPDEASREQG